MPRLVSLRYAALATLASLLLVGTAQAEKPYEQTMNIVYAETDGIGLLMDVFVPTGPKNGHAIIDVASGAWSSDRGKIRDHEQAQMFDIFCSRGYTVFAVRPGSSSKFSIPEMVKHLKLAIRWVKARSNQYGIEPDNLVMSGASAGGHLTCLTVATSEDGNPDSKNEDRFSTHVKAAVAFFPPTDFLNYGREREADDRRIPRGISSRLFPLGAKGMTDEEIYEQLGEISPVRFVTSKFPPLLLIHGDADIIVPLQQSHRMVEACEQCGVSVELIVKPGGGHPWPTIHEEVAIAGDWLDRRLGLAVDRPATASAE